MARIIRTTVDGEGNVHVDFSGFVGEECLAEDQRLHQDLAQLGLAQVVETKSKKPDAQAAPVGCLRKAGLQAPKAG